jgi:hypothetical protein
MSVVPRKRECPSGWRLAARVILIAMTILTGMASLFYAFLLVGTVNPFLLCTVCTVTLNNQSGEDLWITPVGTMGRGHIGPNLMGVKQVLSQLRWEVPALPSKEYKDLPLGNGEQRRIIYDGELLHFTDLLLRRRSAEVSTMSVAHYDGRHWTLNLTNGEVLIRPADLSHIVQPDIADAVDRAVDGNWLGAWIWTWPTAFAVGCVFLLLSGLRGAVPPRLRPDQAGNTPASDNRSRSASLRSCRR